MEAESPFFSDDIFAQVEFALVVVERYFWSIEHEQDLAPIVVNPFEGFDDFLVSDDLRKDGVKTQP